MNKLSNWLTYGLLLLGAVRCNAGKETPSPLNAAASSFLKKALSPGTVIAGILSFAQKPSSSSDELAKFALVGGAFSSACEVLMRWLYARVNRDEQHEPISWQSFVSTYGAHILATVAGDKLRNLYDSYTTANPQTALSITCLAALLATCVNQKSIA